MPETPGHHRTTNGDGPSVVDRLEPGGGLELMAQLIKTRTPDTERFIGRVLAGYQIVEQIAVGGMGLVFRARRVDGSFERDVAIKLSPAGALSSLLHDRFLREQSILASLEHPDIAQVHDAGTTSEGWPYFVMELVAGLHFDEYHRKHRVPLRDKLVLLLRVIDAVAYAHSRLIVHRDLKPSNVLIQEDGAPKLLDFGIAKVVAEDASPASFTSVLTPEFASPEQLRGAPISVASDIYQLGLLFLTAFEQRDPGWRATRLRDVGRSVPLKASDIIVDDLPSDVEAIINKTLSTAPEERYASATDLANDVRRYLDGYPISARRPGLLTTAVKFVRRNAIASALSFAAIAALIGFTVLSIQQQAEAESARLLAEAETARAQQERDRADEITGFLIGLFDANRPNESLGKELTARELLERGEQRIDELEARPGLQASLLQNIASIYSHLGDQDRAIRLAERSLAVREEQLGASSLELAPVLSSLTRMYTIRGRLEDAMASGRRAYEIYSEARGAEHHDTLVAMQQLQFALQQANQLERSEAMAREQLRIRRKVHGENHVQVTMAISSLAVVLHAQGRLTEATHLIEEVLAWNKVQLPENHPWVAEDLLQYGWLLARTGRLAEADEAMRASLAMGREVHDAGHPFIARSLWGVAHVAFLDLRLEEALAMQREAVELAAQADSWPHPERAGSLVLLGSILREMGDHAAAEVALRDGKEQLIELYGPTDSRTLNCDLQLGRLHAERGNRTAAHRLLNPLLEIVEGPVTMHRTELVGAYVVLARLARAEGRFEAAHSHLEAGLELLGDMGVEPPQLVPFQLETGRLMLDWNRPEDAVEPLELARRSLREADPEQGRLWVLRALLAEAAAARNEGGNVKQQLAQAIDAMAERLPDRHPDLRRARGVLARL